MELKGTFSVTGQKAVARVDMIEAEVGNPLSIIEILANTARAHGATALRIEGTVANPKLMRVLERKYGFKTEGASGYIELMLN